MSLTRKVAPCMAQMGASSLNGQETREKSSFLVSVLVSLQMCLQGCLITQSKQQTQKGLSGESEGVGAHGHLG